MKLNLICLSLVILLIFSLNYIENFEEKKILYSICPI